MNKVYCIIPAYNEEKTIINVINAVKPLVANLVVVDDSSSDKTYQLVKAQGVAVLKHIINRGQGAALQTGNEYALQKGADIIIHFDADGQFEAKEIRDVIEPILNEEADIVLGSRFLSKKSNIPWMKKNIILPLAKMVNKIFINLELTDPQNGFRAMTGEVAKKIIIRQDGMAHCSEILYQISKNNFRLKEVPVTIHYHNFGQRFSGGVKIIKDLLIAKLID